jgi:hypothetical protein
MRYPDHAPMKLPSTGSGLAVQAAAPLLQFTTELCRLRLAGRAFPTKGLLGISVSVLDLLVGGNPSPRRKVVELQVDPMALQVQAQDLARELLVRAPTRF